MSDIPICANFFPDISVIGNDCLRLSLNGTGGCEDPMVIDGEVYISDEPGNGLSCLADGLYSAPEILCYRIEFHHPGELCLTDLSCATYEYIPANSTVTMSAPYLTVPSAGSSVVYLIKDENGITLSSLSIPPGAETGTWSPSVFTATSDLYVTGCVVGIGSSSPGCGLSQSALICEPGSAFAPGGLGAGNGGSGVQSFTVTDTSCVNLTLSGLGTLASPLDVAANLTIDPAGDNIIECRSGGLYASAAVASGQIESVLENPNPGVWTHNSGAPGAVDEYIIAPVKFNGSAFTAGEKASGILTSSVAVVAGSAFQINNTTNTAILRIDPDSANERLEIGPYGGLYGGPEHTSVGFKTNISGSGSHGPVGDNGTISQLYTRNVDNILVTTLGGLVITNPSLSRSMNVLAAGGSSLMMTIDPDVLEGSADNSTNYQANLTIHYRVNNGAWAVWRKIENNAYNGTMETDIKVTLGEVNNQNFTQLLAPGATATIDFKTTFFYTQSTPTTGRRLKIHNISWTMPNVSVIGMTV